MDKETIYELADRYLSGALSEEERQAVDQQLESDEAFGQAFARVLVAKQEIKEQAQAKWKEELMTNFQNDSTSSSADTVSSEPPPRHRMSSGRSYLGWLAAAASVLLIVVAYMLLQPFSGSSDLFAEASESVYQKRIDAMTVRSGGENFKTVFHQQQYTKALDIANQQLKSVEELDQAIWQERIGFCYWKLEKWDQAYQAFQELESNELLLPEKNPGVWYQALTFLAMKQEGKGKVLLEKLSTSEGHAYQEAADKLLMRLK